jgi:hypothetical protein
MPRRFTIHPPYLVDRIRTDTPENTRSSFNSLMAELHRWLRYMTDANDSTQVTLGVLEDSAASESQGIHAKMMIRVSLDF